MPPGYRLQTVVFSYTIILNDTFHVTMEFQLTLYETKSQKSAKLTAFNDWQAMLAFACNYASLSSWLL